MHEAQRDRTRELLREEGIDRALFVNPASVKWLTGLAHRVETGVHPFAGGPSLVWYSDDHFALIVLDAYGSDADGFAEQSNCSVVTYEGYRVLDPVRGPENLADTLRQLLSGLPGSTVGMEERDLPASLMKVAAETLPTATFTSIDRWLEPLRLIKTDEEIRKLEANFALNDLGHAAAREAVRVGRREIDVWNDVHGAVQQSVGRRVILGEDCLVGHRQQNVGGWPLNYDIRPNDSFIVDLAACVNGYWSDSCRTYYATEPTPLQARMHQATLATLEYAGSLLRPGKVVSEFDREVRAAIEENGFPAYTHHTGHGIGASVHEAPRLVPNNDAVLREGMVVLVEPGIYLSGETAVRLEDAFLITADGATRLTKYNAGLTV